MSSVGASSMTSCQGLRVLFLHELEGAPGSEKQRLVEKAIGKQRVKAPNLKTRQAIMLYVLIFIILSIICISATIAAAVLARWFVWICVFFGSILLLCLIYWVGGRGATHYMVLNAVKIAEKNFHQQRPNVIVGTSFGAVVALSMDVPRVPLLLLSPAHEQYARFMRLRSPFKLAPYPYVTIVHGSGDKSVPLDDSIRLVETAEVGRCRLEVVDDGHMLKSVTSEDVRSWIEEVYVNGREQVLRMAKEGSKDVDASLFNADEESSEAGGRGGNIERAATATGQSTTPPPSGGGSNV